MSKVLVHGSATFNRGYAYMVVVRMRANLGIAALNSDDI